MKHRIKIIMTGIFLSISLQANSADATISDIKESLSFLIDEYEEMLNNLDKEKKSIKSNYSLIDKRFLDNNNSVNKRFKTIKSDNKKLNLKIDDLAKKQDFKVEDLKQIQNLKIDNLTQKIEKLNRGISNLSIRVSYLTREIKDNKNLSTVVVPPTSKVTEVDKKIINFITKNKE